MPLKLGGYLTEERPPEERGPGPGELPRWPGAPEQRPGNTVAECPACGEDSTLCYRCSECGYRLGVGE